MRLLTISDRASQNLYAEDLSGKAMQEVVGASSNDFHAAGTSTVVPDNVDEIRKAIRAFVSDSNEGAPDLILTSGGTGFAPTDVTPEAVEPLIGRRADSIVAYMQNEATKITPMACLSRTVIGVLKDSNTMLITLPGKPKAVKENMEILLRKGVILHTIR